MDTHPVHGLPPWSTPHEFLLDLDFLLEDSLSLVQYMYIKAKAWDFPVMTEQMRLISYLSFGLFAIDQQLASG